MGINAFTKTGNTVTFLAATTAPTAVQAVSSTLVVISTASSMQVLLLSF
jgi:hypothetical protein